MNNIRSTQDETQGNIVRNPILKTWGQFWVQPGIDQSVDNWSISRGATIDYGIEWGPNLQTNIESPMRCSSLMHFIKGIGFDTGVGFPAE
jgi:hypothetical protein